jgi:hypothetical protein
MRAVARDIGGAEIDVAGRTRLTDPELRRARDLAFVRLRKQGYAVAEVARLYRVTERYVYLRLARLPAAARERALAC